MLSGGTPTALLPLPAARLHGPRAGRSFLSCEEEEEEEIMY